MRLPKRAVSTLITLVVLQVYQEHKAVLRRAETREVLDARSSGRRMV